MYLDNHYLESLESWKYDNFNNAVVDLVELFATTQVKGVDMDNL